MCGANIFSEKRDVSETTATTDLANPPETPQALVQDNPHKSDIGGQLGTNNPIFLGMLR